MGLATSVEFESGTGEFVSDPVRSFGARDGATSNDF